MREIIEKETDLWQYLVNTNKDILLYGMGDGADKILDVCEKKNIKVCGVFASDGFAKNKVFRSFTVTDYSSAKEKFSDFIVLVSFATSRDEVLENIFKIADENELYVPDVPVFGEGLFDKSYVLQNIEKFERVYNLLSDELSKRNYINLILGKMTGKIKYLISAETSVDEVYENIVPTRENSSYADIGAYNGDTIRQYLSYFPDCKKIYAFEPDKKNYKKLLCYAENNGIDTSAFYNIAGWDKKETLTFYSRSGRNSAKTTSHKNAKETEILADRCDDYIDSNVDFINIDAEGSDKNVIRGLWQTIKKYRPTISCAIYHRNEDFFELPLLLYELYDGCKIYIRHFKYLPAWDSNVYVKKT